MSAKSKLRLVHSKKKSKKVSVKSIYQRGNKPCSKKKSNLGVKKSKDTKDNKIIY